jgi:hypothetical protein
LTQTSFQGQFSKLTSHSAIGGRNRNYRRQRGSNSFKKFQHESFKQPLIDIDFHEEFPPLPKSVKPDQSPTLQKIAQAATTAKESTQSVDTPDPLEPVMVSYSYSSGTLDGRITPLPYHCDVEPDFLSHHSSVQGTPAFPHAPPSSSAELSTAGNTAPSTPTVKYVRPRLTVQSLHDRLLHANATLATLQEARRLANIPRSVSLSPVIRPAIGELAKETEELSGVMESLDTTVGVISVEKTVGNEEWIARGRRGLIEA